MSGEREALERLCAQRGIATAYHDIWGNWRVVPDASLRALLAEFGIDASTPERAAQATATLREARWRDPLEPVLVVAEGRAPWHARVRVPADCRALAWRLDEEQGRRHEGAFDATSAPELRREAVGGIAVCEREVPVGVALPAGYHRLLVDGGPGARGEALVVCAPERCYRPAALDGERRAWGPAVQLYALRSERNWGIGDFGDLAQVVDDWAALGADAVGVSPLHALFPRQPAHASPYSPSTRQWLNVLHLDVEAIAEFGACTDAQHLVRSASFQRRLAGLREAALIDYEGVAAAKFEVLELLYAWFRAQELAAATPRAHAFREFQARGGESLRRHALFEALQERFAGKGPLVHGWPDWPREVRDVESTAVARFAAGALARIEYHEYLQWQAHAQLAQAGARCAARRMGVGLYLDLAVSASHRGSDAWGEARCYALGASIGAPPDGFNPGGQDWGLPPLRPDRLRAEHYAPLRRALAAGMRDAGALRIDHVMGLMRMFWVPAGATPLEGAYVHYAFDEQLAIVVLESHRHRCAVIGEDLGTVPDEVREKLARAGALATRLVYFERHAHGPFKGAADYPREALVAVSTHDLPTLAGWWTGRDLALWRELGACTEEEYRRRLEERARERAGLMHALRWSGLLPGSLAPEEVAAGPLEPALAEAVCALAAAAPSRLMMLQPEDALGVLDQANLPGTTSGHPNWRRKLPLTLERMREDPGILAFARRVDGLRRTGGG